MRHLSPFRALLSQSALRTFEDVAGGLSLVVLLIVGLNLPALL